jgi:transcriptional regulator with XRE-family HTH domain
MAVEANALGEYLRARRQQVRPEDVGLVPGTRRRVTGLRREELAMLAGISSEYYLRLEVGRDKHPSAQVLDALARALRLNTKATQHLHSLANPTGSDNPDLEVARAYALTELIDQFLMPAIVANRYLARCVGRKCDCSRPVAGVHTGTKLPTLALFRSRRPRDLPRLGRGDRKLGGWFAGTGRFL